MTVDLHVAPNALHDPVGTDQNRGANDPEEGPAIQGFFAPGAIGLQQFMFLIGDQRNIELVLVAERFLSLQGIGGDAQDRGSELRERTGQAGEVHRLPGEPPSPPSRGRRNAGALAPSASRGAVPAGDSAFAATSGATLAVVFALAAFNGFDAPLCDGPLPALVVDFRAAGLSVFRKF